MDIEVNGPIGREVLSELDHRIMASNGRSAGKPNPAPGATREYWARVEIPAPDRASWEEGPYRTHERATRHLRYMLRHADAGFGESRAATARGCVYSVDTFHPYRFAD
jgi:hypothetical protein